mgnify:CR=1 FL=1
MTRKKYMYIAHPYRGNPEKNLQEVTAICRELYANNPNVIPISPIHLFSWMDPKEGDMEIFYDVIDFCDHNIVFCGDWLGSEGCRMEAEYYRRKRDWRHRKILHVVLGAVVVCFVWLVLG